MKAHMLDRIGRGTGKFPSLQERMTPGQRLTFLRERFSDQLDQVSRGFALFSEGLKAKQSNLREAQEAQANILGVRALEAAVTCTAALVDRSSVAERGLSFGLKLASLGYLLGSLRLSTRPLDTTAEPYRDTESVFERARLGLLSGETEVGLADMEARHSLAKQLLAIPETELRAGLASLQYLVSQTGCPNVCAFCSQGAGVDVWRLEPSSLRNLLAALKKVDFELRRSGSADGSERSILGSADHRRTGVMSLYHDTDVGSDPNMLELVRILCDDFGLRSWVSTVGWSRHNKELQAMHEALVRDYCHAFEGFRVSITPYTDGVTERDPRTSREEYIYDVANLLRTYRPLVDLIGTGQKRFVMEMRFPPMIYTQDNQITDAVISGHHIIQVGDIVAVSVEPAEELETARIAGFEGTTPQYSTTGTPYYLMRDSSFLNPLFSGPTTRARRFAIEIACRASEGRPFPEALRAKEVSLYRFENADGPYYAIDPQFTNEGHFNAIHIYPSSDTRKAGYSDATRYFLNSLLTYKAALGLASDECFECATWDDVEGVLELLVQAAKELPEFTSARYVRNDVVPLVKMQIEILRAADFPPSAFFDPGFVVDTGQIINQGIALKLFGGLVSVQDEPFTPQQERVHGPVSLAAGFGDIWKIGPLPVFEGTHVQQTGVRNGPMAEATTGDGNVYFGPLHQTTLTAVPEHAHVLKGVRIERISRPESVTHVALPGLKKDSS